MPISVDYDPDRGFLICSVRGEFELDAFQSFLEELTSSTTIAHGINTLWDLRQMDFSSVDADHIQRILAIRRRFRARDATARVALVVSQDLGFRMSRTYEALAVIMPTRICVFRRYEEAEQWLLEGEDG